MITAGWETGLAGSSSLLESDVPIIAVGVERSRSSSYEDRGTPGLSPGDRFSWGPNPLFDAENVVDTGVFVTGMCAVFNLAGDCWAVETITYGLDHATLRVHGILPGNGDPATFVVIDGTGPFSSATGTLTVTANPDGITWFRRFELSI